ncbi:hypothetical protein H6P81_015977 [Aristolochia fimbriata]|uniref:Secreted protein n=1 Tax=Aristolochia fimbriata TaxID=158543 RepID=A0AAV7E723_ARIFI|nr:hypothetical protein H6P81_015977 [Aristolochia fimbriata]
MALFWLRHAGGASASRTAAHAQWCTLDIALSGASGRMSRSLVVAVFPSFATDLPRPCWVAGIPWCTGGRNRASAFSPPGVVSRPGVLERPDATKCSWTHVNAAVPVDLVGFAKRVRSPNFCLIVDAPSPVLRLFASGAC